MYKVYLGHYTMFIERGNEKVWASSPRMPFWEAKLRFMTAYAHIRCFFMNLSEFLKEFWPWQ